MSLLKEKILELTQELQNAHGDDAVWDIFIRLCDILISDVNGEIRQDSDSYQSVLSLLTDIEMKVTDIMDKHYARSILHILKGEKTGYLSEIEEYIQLFIKEHGEFTYEEAYWDIIEVLEGLAKDDSEYDSYIKNLSNILSKHIPQSAFCAYLNYLAKTYIHERPELEVLGQILGIDPDWYVTHIDMGDIFYEQKKWAEAIKSYEAGVAAGVLWKTDEVFFRIAYAYDKTKQHAKSIENYQKCLAIRPDHLYANHNLGFEYKKIQDYEQALLYIDKSIALGMDGYNPYRNKLEVLIKTKRNDEAKAFAIEHPTQFKTKYYRNLLAKATGGQADILEGLEQTTANEYAGTIAISGGNSGLQLYAHQQDAIRDMSRKILNKDKYAGLLVLPTGGGKTLTATYWLMGNILDSGKKVIWLAHRHELLNQARSGFEKVSYSDIARRKTQFNFRIISGQHDRSVNIKSSDDVIIASKTSLHKNFDYLLNKWLRGNREDVFLVIDEAHHATAKEYRELIDKIRATAPSVKILGLTATPFRTADNEQGLLKKIFYDDIVYQIGLRELISRGILAEPIFEEAETKVDMVSLFQTSDGAAVLARIEKDSFFDIDSIGADIATKIAKNADRNNAIVNKYLENKEKYGQTLVFTLNIDMAIALNALFKARGVESDYVVSDIKDIATGVTTSSKDNPEKIQKFRDGELNVLINVNILTEGTDLPKVQSVFLTRPTKSTILMTQMIGRALRGLKAGGTKDCYIVSFVDDWQDRIAWVNPERLFIDENADFMQLDPETRKMAMRLVAIQKIEEFARIADGTLDKKLEQLSFIERIPVGFYKFSYLVPAEDDQDEAVNCNVLVYDCMQKAYAELFDWLPNANLRDVDAAARHIDGTLFTETDRLIGYRKQDVIDIIRYYEQTEELPEFIALAERDEYDVGRLANHIVSQRMDDIARKDFISGEWSASESRWSAFYGLNNQKAFRKTITDEIDKIINPDDYEATSLKPITQLEQRQIQDMPLYEIRQKFPELGEKIRAAVFDKFTDAEGYYYSAQGGHKSRSKLDFQIDHIMPMAKGGKTVVDNLQLLTHAENMIKGAN